MSDERELLKISELARRAGVGRGTIQHYLREGLLPRPVKTHRNMAYYDASSVERIKAIKELQTHRYMPLSVIRKFLGSGGQHGAAARNLMEIQQAALASLTPSTPRPALNAEGAAKAFGLGRKVINELHRLGLVTFHRESGEEVLRDADLDVLAAVANLDRAGFRESAGFKTSDLLIYRAALVALLRHEIQTFVRATSTRPTDATIKDLARMGIDAATGLVVALRRKLMVDALTGEDEEPFANLAKPRGKRKAP